MRAYGHHRGGDSSRQHHSPEHQEQPNYSGHTATGRINEQDRADGCQREHTGGMPAGEGLSNSSDSWLEHVLGQARGGGHCDGRQDGPGPPAGRHASKDQRQGDKRNWSQRAKSGKPGQQHGKMAQPGPDPWVDRRIEPYQLSPAGDLHRQSRRHRRARRQQCGGRQAKASRQQLLRHRPAPGNAPQGPPMHQPTLHMQCDPAASSANVSPLRWQASAGPRRA
jgi:hypothetical protein